MLEPATPIPYLHVLHRAPETLRSLFDHGRIRAYLLGRVAEAPSELGREAMSRLGALRELWSFRSGVSLEPLSEAERRRFRARLRPARAGVRPVRRPGEPGEWSAPAPRRTEQEVIDARARFASRASAHRMAAVEVDGARFEPAPLIDLQAWRMPRSGGAPLQLFGDVLSLWYVVDGAALARQVEPTPVTMFGRGVVGVCIGRYFRIETAPDLPPLTDECLVELTLVTLVRTRKGPALHPIRRLVDPSRLKESMRFLCQKRPRELAFIEFERNARWNVSAQWRSGADRLEVEVEGRHWLNRWGGTALLAGMLARHRLCVPVGGGCPQGTREPSGWVQLGRAYRVRLPERLHQGLLSADAVEKPFSVILLPQVYPSILTHEP